MPGSGWRFGYGLVACRGQAPQRRPARPWFTLACAADDAAGFGAHRLPEGGLDAAVSGESADECLPLDAGEADFGRVGFAKNAPHDDRRHGEQHEQQQQFLQESGSKNYLSWSGWGETAKTCPHEWGGP